MDLVPFGSKEYWLMLGALLFGRGMDFLSTWVASPNLVLEANPVSKKLGWKWGLPLNFLMCVGFAVWPLPSLVVTTTSVLVAAHNFQSAWLMRTLGEHGYRFWMAERIRETHLGLYHACLLTQNLLVASLGAVLMYFSKLELVPFAVGMGIITYALAVTFYTLLAVWRLRRSTG